MTGRRWRRLGVLAVVVLLLADLAAWAWAQRALGDGLARWATAMRAQGVTVTLGPASPGGWPLLATRALADLTLAAAGIELRASPAVLRLSPLDPAAVTVDLPGTVTLQAPGAAPVRASAGSATLRLPRPGSGPATLDARALVAGGGWGSVTAALLHAQLGRGGDGTLDLAGSAQSIGLPAGSGASLPLGPRIASVAGELALRGGVPLPSAPMLAAWRDAGGALEVRRFALGYGPLGLSGQGRFRLDAALQPVGRAELHVVGQDETLDALAAGHAISQHVAMAARAVLSLLAAPPPGGGAPRVDTTLVVGDGLLAVAGFPLLRLPTLAWPAIP